MDGNGRWATKLGYPRVFGHVRGARRVREIVRESSRRGIQALTLYAFSTENWLRPETETSVLWRIFRKYLRSEVDELDANGVKLAVIGEVERLPPEVRGDLAPVIERLAKNEGLRLNLAVSYGSRREIVEAARSFARDCVQGRCSPDSLDEGAFGERLWTRELGDLAEVDLLIRTSGELRISNFLLWQAAYAEMVFAACPWPEYTVERYTESLGEFARRQRRFGALPGGDE